MIRRVIGLALLLAGPVAAETADQPGLPDGYPPAMGTVTGTLGGVAQTWQPYDFSVGAFDASAWVSDEDDQITLRIMAFPEGQPDKMEDRLRIVVVFGLFPSPGNTPDEVLVEVLGEQDIDGRKMTSDGKPVSFTLETFSRTSYAYGHTTGHFETVVCLKRGETSKVTKTCQPIKARFDTAIQFDNM